MLVVPCKSEPLNWSAMCNACHTCIIPPILRISIILRFCKNVRLIVNNSNSKMPREPELMENVHGFFATEDVLITTNNSTFGPTVMTVEWRLRR